MPSFTIEGRDYELITLDQLPDMELGDLEILTEFGKIDLEALDDIKITMPVVIALVLISMRRTNPDATIADARRGKISVLTVLAEQIANSNGAPPPTGRARSGRPRSKNASDSSRGT
jgi:hypothetical protein